MQSPVAWFRALVQLLKYVPQFHGLSICEQMTDRMKRPQPFCPLTGSHFAVTQHKGQAEKSVQTLMENIWQDRAHREAKVQNLCCSSNVPIVKKKLKNKKPQEKSLLL